MDRIDCHSIAALGVMLFASRYLYSHLNSFQEDFCSWHDSADLRLMPMIGTSEAATRLGISPRRVAAMIQTGQLHAEKVGKTWVIDADDLARFAKSQRR